MLSKSYVSAGVPRSAVKFRLWRFLVSVWSEFVATSRFVATFMLSYCRNLIHAVDYVDLLILLLFLLTCCQN